MYVCLILGFHGIFITLQKAWRFFLPVSPGKTKQYTPNDLFRRSCQRSIPAMLYQHWTSMSRNSKRSFCQNRDDSRSDLASRLNFCGGISQGWEKNDEKILLPESFPFAPEKWWVGNWETTFLFWVPACFQGRSC